MKSSLQPATTDSRYRLQPTDSHFKDTSLQTVTTENLPADPPLYAHVGLAQPLAADAFIPPHRTQAPASTYFPNKRSFMDSSSVDLRAARSLAASVGVMRWCQPNLRVILFI